jgi:hypothetical protein
MKKVFAILATTHVDRHNEAFALSALEGMVELLNRSYLPVGVEHDPRVPPIGRVLSAEVRKREDGEFEVAADVEIFEPGDRIKFGMEKRRTIVRCNVDDRIAVIDDRAFLTDEDQSVIGEIRNLLDARAETESKKALDPIAVLTIAVTIVGTKIAEGFVGQIGGDVWEAVKGKLKTLFRRPRNSPARLLNFAATVEINGERRLVEVILSDPSDADIDQLDPTIVDEAISGARAVVDSNAFLVRFVYSYSRADGLRARFAVAASGAPVLFDAPSPAIRPINHLSLGGVPPQDT